MFLMESQPSVVAFSMDPKSEMVALGSDWLTQFRLILKEQLQGSTPILTQMFLMGSQQNFVTFYVDPKSKITTLAFD